MKRLTDVYSLNDINEQLDNGYRIIKCPVCGNETFNDYSICPHCQWEQDGTINEDLYSSCNKSTIKEYRKIYNNTIKTT